MVMSEKSDVFPCSLSVMCCVCMQLVLQFMVTSLLHKPNAHVVLSTKTINYQNHEDLFPSI